MKFLKQTNNGNLDIGTGTPPTDWTQVAPNALAIVPILLISALVRGNPYFDNPIIIINRGYIHYNHGPYNGHKEMLITTMASTMWPLGYVDYWKPSNYNLHQ